MAVSLPQDRMPEAEVSLLLAFYLLDQLDSCGVAEVAIDGAQVRVRGNEIFPITPYLSHSGWTRVEQRGLNAGRDSTRRTELVYESTPAPALATLLSPLGPRRSEPSAREGPLSEGQEVESVRSFKARWANF
jgi:hypothetical protein